MENLGKDSPRRDSKTLLHRVLTPKQQHSTTIMPSMPELTTEIKSSTTLLPGCVAQELSPTTTAVEPLKEEGDVGPRILTGIAKIAHHHLIEKSTMRLYSGISKVPGLHLLLQWMWRKTVEQHLAKVVRPCQVVAAMLSRCVDCIDTALSNRIIRLLTFALDTTTRLGSVGSGTTSSDAPELLGAIQSMQKIQHLNAQLAALQSECGKRIPQESVERMRQELQEESTKERRDLEKRLKKISSSKHDLEKDCLDKAGIIYDREETLMEVEKELHDTREQLVQVESYRRSSVGQSHEAMEWQLSETKMNLVEVESEKDDIELIIVEIQEELQRRGFPPLDACEDIPEGCRPSSFHESGRAA